MNVHYYIGLDLGQRHDPTAIAVVERATPSGRSGARVSSGVGRGFAGRQAGGCFRGRSSAGGGPGQRVW